MSIWLCVLVAVVTSQGSVIILLLLYVRRVGLSRYISITIRTDDTLLAHGDSTAILLCSMYSCGFFCTHYTENPLWHIVFSMHDIDIDWEHMCFSSVPIKHWVVIPMYAYHDPCHYCDAIMGTVASQVTSLMIVYTTVYSDADQSKHQSSASLAFVWGIHRDRWITRTKGQLRGKCFNLMTSSCYFAIL